MYRTTAIAACVAAGLVSAGAIAAPAAKPTDPQIAHIAYTAGQLDVEAGIVGPIDAKIRFGLLMG